MPVIYANHSYLLTGERLTSRQVRFCWVTFIYVNLFVFRLCSLVPHTSALPTSEKHIHNKTGARRRPDSESNNLFNNASAVWRIGVVQETLLLCNDELWPGKTSVWLGVCPVFRKLNIPKNSTKYLYKIKPSVPKCLCSNQWCRIHVCGGVAKSACARWRMQEASSLACLLQSVGGIFMFYT